MTARVARLAAVVLVVWASWGIGGVAGAQTSGERIVSYVVDVTVRTDGDLEVAETIIYDFGTARRHGIDRYVPVRFDWDGDLPDGLSGDGWQRVTELTNVSIGGSSGTPTQYRRTDDGDVVWFRIGDPDRTITGQHTYTINYRLHDVATPFDDHDEIYFDAIGVDWNVPIDAARVTMTIENGTAADAACFAGPVGSQLGCDELVNDGDVVARHQAFPRNNGLSVVLGLDKGVLDEPTPVFEQQWSLRRGFELTWLTVVGGVGLLVAGVAWVLRTAWLEGRDRRFGGVPVAGGHSVEGAPTEIVPLRSGEHHPVEFAPPEGIRPGHLGTLWDETANHLDVTAMIVDLAVRGWLRIEEVDGVRDTDYQFVRLRDVETDPEASSLWSAERLILTSLFRDGGTVRLSELKQHFADRMSLVQSALYDDAVLAKWFPQRPDVVRQRWLGTGIAIVVFGVAATAAAAWFLDLGTLFVGIPVVGLVLAGLSWRMPRRTAEGRRMLSRVKGFRELFAAGEGERQAYREDATTFSKFLPYAIVFGETERWAQRFAALGVDPAAAGVTDFYVGRNTGDLLLFTAAMHSFSDTSTGALAAVTPSSTGGMGGSGFSGGGFSGGGFGGGGGGSW